MDCLIVSGRSGSGKSYTLQVLEDLGFYCVDNIPVSLLPALEAQIHHRMDKVAVSIDARNISVDVTRFQEILKLIKSPRRNWEIIYLDADDATLLKRFSETRRRHPLTTQETSLEEALTQEKAMLEPLASMADLMIDTRNLSIHQLRDKLSASLLDKPKDSLTLLFHSFGYKFGIPLDADFVFDVRTLPNPHWEPELRELTGKDQPIKDFLSEKAKVQQMLKQMTAFLDTWVPEIAKDNRNYLTVAIGCTGGKHRSVFITETLQQHFQQTTPYRIQARHRELD